MHENVTKSRGWATVLALAMIASVACATHATSGGGRPATSAAPSMVTPLPRFDRAVLLETTSETSANVSIGDLDGDGHLDIVLAKGRHWPLVDRVLLGDGRGGFPVAYDLGPTADRSYSGRLADLDGDGDLDVVIGNDAPDPKLVYLNDGKGRFSPGSTYGRPEWPTRNAAVADLDGDGLPDIVVANRAGGMGANYVCLNRGQARFDADCIAFSSESATTITPADIDGDGRVDLVVPNRDGGQSYVYRGDGRGGFSQLTRIPFGTPDATIRVAETADLDGDGRVDIVALDERIGVEAYFGLGREGFSPGVPIEGRPVVPYALAVGDLNRDGAIDVVIGHVEAPSTVHFNDGSGRRFTPTTFGDFKGTTYGLAIGDLDEDGRPDIAVARSEAPNVVYLSTAPLARRE